MWYISFVTYFHWDIDKNEKLIKERHISFEEVVLCIEEGHVIDIIQNPNVQKYGHQMMFVVDVNHYVYLVPFVAEGEKVFLKTVIPSRKATRKYLGGT